MAGKRVLVVDDDVKTVELVKLYLNRDGYRVLTANDGIEALRIAREGHPDLVVLDIKMGGHNGLDILQDIRETYYELPVILCSAYSVYKYDMRSIAADYYVVKGSDLRELKIKVKMALAGVEGMQWQLGDVLNDTQLPERSLTPADIICFRHYPLKWRS